jgi:rare lipoprotein A
MRLPLIAAAVLASTTPTAATPVTTHHAHRRQHRWTAWSTGLASWYALPGNGVACGGVYSGWGVASRTLPCGTRVRICLARCMTLVVDDYGPAAWTGRILDVQQNAAAAIGLTTVGVATVRYAVNSTSVAGKAT